MLSARKIPKACQSCRLQLLHLFENGFAGSATSKASQSQHTPLRSRAPRNPHNLPARRFYTAVKSPEKKEEVIPATSTPEASDIESIVRQARQTFGETLPKDYLSTEEYTLYERLYGPPLRETRSEDLEYLPLPEDVEPEQPRNVISRRNADGGYDEVNVNSKLGFSIIKEELERSHADPDKETHLGVGQMDEADRRPRIQGQNRREIDAITKLQEEMAAEVAAEVARRVDAEEDAIEEFDEEEEEWEEEMEEEDIDIEDEEYASSNEIRTHPHTLAGRSRTDPTTIQLPQQQLVEPISELLSRTNWKHLTEAAEKAFGGRGLPYSASTPVTKSRMPQKHVGLDAAQHRMSEVEADAYLTAVMPATYASVLSVLVEVRKRLGTEWIRRLITQNDGPRILDAGGAGASIIAWREMLQAEWDVMIEDGLVPAGHAPVGKTTVFTGPSALRHRISRFLDNTTFLPRLPDYLHSSNSEDLLDGSPAQARKAYDIIVAPHTLFPLKEDFRRKNMVENLWSMLDPNGGVLILIEKGIPRGFEAIAGARSLLLDSHIASPGESPIENSLQTPSSRFTEKEEGTIIAPCTNHKTCPMYPIPGLTPGRKDFCHFGQRYIRPPFLQQVLKATRRNHEDVKYSYVAVRRGVDARKADATFMQGDEATERSFEGYEELNLPGSDTEEAVKFNPLSLPRAILAPLKRRGHVTLDLCTPSGKLERWTVPKSFSRTAYRDARKSHWGDLWALGAKTRIARSPRLGRSNEDSRKGTHLKGIRHGKISGKNRKINKFNLVMGRDGAEGIEEDASQRKYFKPEKRTKGGRFWKDPKPISEQDLG